MSDFEPQLGVLDLLVAMRELQSRFGLDTVRVTRPTDQGMVALAMTEGAPIVIEDDRGHSMIVEGEE
jgi:hypothetical protein